MSPLVTIAIPVYNGANFIAQAINSALIQTYENIEIIVVNDGSKDNGETERIALSYGEKIRYFYKENGGVSSALNLAIQKMQGEYFSWLSHDDLYNAHKIEEQIKVHLNTTNHNIITYSDYSIFSVTPHEATSVHLNQIEHTKFRLWLTYTSSLHGCTLLIPKAAFMELGNFNENARFTQDFELWFKLAKHYQFIHIDQVLVMARHHDQQGTKTKKILALKESDDLHASFIEQLTPEELNLSGIDQQNKAFIRLYKSMWARGFKHAAKKAEQLAYSNGATRLEMLLAKVNSSSQYLILCFLRCLISPQTRLKIRSIIQHS